MIPDAWRRGEIAVIGLSRTGLAVAKFLSNNGFRVYASDPDDSPTVREAAESVRASGGAVDVGQHDLDRITRAVLVVPSPGVPPSAPPLKAALDADRPVVAELDLALLFLDNVPSIVVSGTNGKSTTTALIAHVLKKAGVEAVAAGNIGFPLIEVAASSPRPDWLVVEASSYQLHFSPNLAPTVGVLTNVSPEHLEWHGTEDAYFADKRRLFNNASAESIWVLNADDAVVRKLASGAAGSRRMWSLSRTSDAWYDLEVDRLLMDGEPLISRSELPLLGDHNVSNALAAALAAKAAGAAPAQIVRGLGSFRSLSHRLEPIREIDDVLWINDSKATNVSSTEVALRAMSRPYVLLLGGLGKGEAYSRLALEIQRGCHDVIAYGDDREKIAHELSDAAPVHLEETIGAAVARARTLSNAGDVVLLSPACASFDQFSDFEERGRVFRDMVEAF
jgi:UDP-N-acetylmuramoylalanine--D-glutamate ligase